MRSEAQRKADARYYQEGRKKALLSTSVDPAIARKIDAARGEASRAEWIRAAILTALR